MLHGHREQRRGSRPRACASIAFRTRARCGPARFHFDGPGCLGGVVPGEVQASHGVIMDVADSSGSSVAPYSISDPRARGDATRQRRANAREPHASRPPATSGANSGTSQALPAFCAITCSTRQKETDTATQTGCGTTTQSTAPTSRTHPTASCRRNYASGPTR